MPVVANCQKGRLNPDRRSCQPSGAAAIPRHAPDNSFIIHFCGGLPLPGGDLHLMRTVANKAGGKNPKAKPTPEQRAEVLYRYLEATNDMTREDMLIHISTHQPPYGLTAQIKEIWTEAHRRACTPLKGWKQHPFFVFDLSPKAKDYAKICIQFRRLRGGLLQGMSGKGGHWRVAVL